MLARHFGPHRNGRVFATAHLLATGSRRPHTVPAVTDFDIGEAVPLFGLPQNFALPYAVDSDTATILFTLHPQPGAVLGAASVTGEQRRLAAVGVRVDLRHLHRFHPLPATPPALQFLVSDDPAERTALAARLQGRGVRSITDPPMLHQLAAQATRFFAVRAQHRATLLWSALDLRAAVLVVSAESLRLATAIQSLLPEAKFVHGQSQITAD
jgi:hypothetical protein